MSHVAQKPARQAATIAARAGVDQDAAHGAVMPPLYLSTNYSFEGFGKKREYDYSRSGNPTRDVLAGQVPAVGALLAHGSGWKLEVTGGNERHVTRLRLHPPVLSDSPN